MSYRLRLYAEDDASPGQVKAAEQRFRDAVEAELGDAALVWPVYAAYTRIVQTYGDAPSEEVLSPGEWAVFSQWQAAELAALTAALGPNRYMGEGQFEIGPV